MSRTFLYRSVSKAIQFTENKVQEVKIAGFYVQGSHVIEEIILKSIAAKERTGFQRLLDQIETGDVLIVTKLNCLGRNAMDVR